MGASVSSMNFFSIKLFLTTMRLPGLHPCRREPSWVYSLVHGWTFLFRLGWWRCRKQHSKGSRTCLSLKQVTLTQFFSCGSVWWYQYRKEVSWLILFTIYKTLDDRIISGFPFVSLRISWTVFLKIWTDSVLVDNRMCSTKK